MTVKKSSKNKLQLQPDHSVQPPASRGADDRARFSQHAGSGAKVDMEQITQVRLRLLENGYAPLPNFDKRCFMKDWPRLEVDEAAIHSWGRRHKRYTATGVRIENGLGALDLDIDDAIMDRIAQAIFDTIDALADETKPLPIRKGKGFKEAWFFRVDEPFKRIYSHAWIRPGETADDGAHRVEIFGGASARELGAYGPHSFDEEGNVKVTYSWPGDDLLAVPLDKLPLITKQDAFAICDTVDRMLEAAGWSIVPRTTDGESEPDRVYDLTPDMRFDLNDGDTVDLDTLRAWVGAGRKSVRCSASWLEGPIAVNRTRCLCSLTRLGHVSIWESASSVTHIEALAKPIEIDMEDVRAALTALTAPGRRDRG